MPGDLRFHDLRHTDASLSLAAGVPVPTVSAMLGHANPSVTLSIYAHAVPGTMQVAADAMDALLRKARG
jgi:integrase